MRFLRQSLFGLFLASLAAALLIYAGQTIVTDSELRFEGDAGFDIGGRIVKDKVVIVKSRKDTPYLQWIAVTSRIEDAGGIVTLQLEEEQTVAVP